MKSPLLRGDFIILKEGETVSKSGNAHVYLRVTDLCGNPYPLTTTDRVALQAILGSDRKRELLSYLRIQDFNIGGVRAPTAFFEVPGAQMSLIKDVPKKTDESES